MGIEINISEELANISLGATEAESIASVLRSQIKNREFLDQFEPMLDKLALCLDVIEQHITPFARLQSETDFNDRFDCLHADYTGCYLKEISRPRALSDEAYENYLVLQTRREFKTSFPLLKRNFERLEKYIDKWVTNDAWLAMSIDNLFKRMQQLFIEVAELKKKDPEDAFIVYRSAFDGFSDFLSLINHKREGLRPAPLLVETQEYKVL